MRPQSSRPRVALRAAVVLLLDAVALLALSQLRDGFELDGPGAALGMAAIVGLINALVWPLVARVALPLNVLTLGGFALALNGVVVVAATLIIPGASIDNWFDGILVTIGMTVITALVASLLAIHDDESWYRNVVRRQARRRGEVIHSDIPGVVLCEIDGLAHEIAARALRDGTMPNLSRWVRDGGHRLERWETDWSSQTGACQAGLLHGSNEDMPAFRWWEKDRDRAIVTNHPRDAEELERRHSDGRGLLHADGASRANILSGDAPHSMLTMSTVLRRRRPIGRDYAAYFAAPYAVAKTLIASIAEYARERRAAARERRRDVRPRIARSRTYALVRAWATVVQLDLQIASVVADMLAGRPVVYTTFLAYDEVAHHSGIERADTLAVLAKVDRQLARIEAAAADAPRPYLLVVLSDHGQSQGATFRQRYGLTLEELVREAGGAHRVQTDSSGDEALSYLSAGLTEMARDETATARAVRTATRRHSDDGVVDLEGVAGAGAGAAPREDGGGAATREGGDEGGEPGGEVGGPGGEVGGPGGEVGERGGAVEPTLPEISVMASGCLGLISFPREPGRLSLERIAELYPELLPALRDHPGIGFVLVRSDREGALAIGAEGINHLDADRVEGADPLAPFGPHAADHVRRTDGFAHCPDLVVNSTYWPAIGEVAAFEELVGSHGGMGGGQGYPFVCFPAGLAWPGTDPVGAEAVHRIMAGWLAALGHAGYAERESAPPAA
ncbi:MAG: phage holin family protein [Solirubrobacterales bacterium]|nr:phage holin family protein [Solirubrobacterales bacterium]